MKPEAETPKHRAPVARRPPGPLTGVTVLLVDDDRDALAALAIELRGAGATTHTADQVQDGLAMMHTYAPDVIVSDLILPSIDGFAFLRAVRRDPVLRRTPAIAVTGHPEQATRRAAMDAGFDRLFVKPLDVGPIVEEVVRMVALRRRGGGS